MAEKMTNTKLSIPNFKRRRFSNNLRNRVAWTNPLERLCWEEIIQKTEWRRGCN